MSVDQASAAITAALSAVSFVVNVRPARKCPIARRERLPVALVAVVYTAYFVALIWHNFGVPFGLAVAWLGLTFAHILPAVEECRGDR